MCYGMGCVYKDYHGECCKSGRLPCPLNDAAVDEYEEYLEEKAERDRHANDEKE